MQRILYLRSMYVHSRICILSQLPFQAAGTIGPSWIIAFNPRLVLPWSCRDASPSRYITLHCIDCYIVGCRQSIAQLLVYAFPQRPCLDHAKLNYLLRTNYLTGLDWILVSGSYPESSAKTVAVPQQTVSRLTLTCFSGTTSLFEFMKHVRNWVATINFLFFFQG